MWPRMEPFLLDSRSAQDKTVSIPHAGQKDVHFIERGLSTLVRQQERFLWRAFERFPSPLRIDDGSSHEVERSKHIALAGSVCPVNGDQWEKRFVDPIHADDAFVVLLGQAPAGNEKECLFVAQRAV